jgi:GNAT superfamily N-acetyltransferase
VASKVHFRRVPHTPKNEATLRYMDKDCFEHDSPFVLDKDSLLWIGRNQEKLPVAYATLTHMYEDRWFLSRAGVLEAARGQGLHKRMIRMRIACMKRLGGSTVVTYCARYNHHSINNLVACGFKTYCPAGDWGGDSAVYLYNTM